VTSWRYPHIDLGEVSLPNGNPVRRPVVTVSAVGSIQPLLAVLDSGSPISVADARLFERFGVDLEVDTPIYEVPLTLGGRSGKIPVFEIQLVLRPPASQVHEPDCTWNLRLGARPNWNLPFAILFGQQGWFEHFATTIDGFTSSVQLPLRT
jgi:hypothetical protein